jgi:hypothetical protein
MEQRWKDTDRGKPKNSEKNLYKFLIIIIITHSQFFTFISFILLNYVFQPNDTPQVTQLR